MYVCACTCILLNPPCVLRSAHASHGETYILICGLSGFETFANVSYAIVGSGPSGWADEGASQKYRRDGEEMGGRMRGTSKYEPELNFIDAEQVGKTGGLFISDVPQILVVFLRVRMRACHVVHVR